MPLSISMATFFCSVIFFSPPRTCWIFSVCVCLVFKILEQLWILLFRHADFFPFRYISSAGLCRCVDDFFPIFSSFFFTSVYFWFTIFNNSINLLHCVVCFRVVDVFFSNSKIIFLPCFFSDMSVQNKNRPENYKLIIAFVFEFQGFFFLRRPFLAKYFFALCITWNHKHTRIVLSSIQQQNTISFAAKFRAYFFFAEKKNSTNHHCSQSFEFACVYSLFGFNLMCAPLIFH